MTLREALRMTTERLQTAGIPEAQLDAEYLLADVVGIPRIHLALEGSTQLSSSQERCLIRYVQERLLRKPLAYVLGEQPFMNLSLEVTPSVLIPRPETELLVEQAQHILKGMHKATVVDVGTGSGNIALSLVQHPNVSQLFAIDISTSALALAQQNALRNHIKRSIQWILGDLLTPLMERKLSVDLIIANLPYVRRDEMGGLSPEVRWEPTLALDGGRGGLSYIISLIAQAEKVLKPEGVLLMEIGAGQHKEVLDILAAKGPWTNAQMLRDLAGHPRIIQTQKGALVGSLNH